jgi:hypothetical protein
MLRGADECAKAALTDLPPGKNSATSSVHMQYWRVGLPIKNSHGALLFGTHAARGQQSLAEACAKHLKEFVEKGK